MVTLPPQVLELAKRPDTVKIMTSINEDGTPHSIVCGTLFVPDQETIGVGQVWLGRTGRNILRDPRVEFLLWGGRTAVGIHCRFREKTEDPAVVDAVNEKLDRMNIKAASVWFFDIVSATDESFGPNVGQKIA